MHTQKKLKRIVVVSILIVCIGASVVIWLNGGIRSVLDDALPTPDPKSGELVDKREAVEANIAQDFKALATSARFTGDDTSKYIACSKGQNNTKRQDGYSNRCAVRVTKFYGSSADFRQQMLQLHELLLANGWESWERDSLPYYMAEYYDNGRTISQLPKVSSGYTKSKKTIAIAYADKDVLGVPDLESAQSFNSTGFPTYEDKNFQDISALHSRLTASNNFVVSVSITSTFFEN